MDPSVTTTEVVNWRVPSFVFKVVPVQALSVNLTTYPLGRGERATTEKVSGLSTGTQSRGAAGKNSGKETTQEEAKGGKEVYQCQ
jgi:hypothetical protein